MEGHLCIVASMRLNHITLPVSSVPDSVEFYVRLGLTQIVANYPTYARLLAPAGDTTLSLHQTDGPDQDGASIHFEVDDVDRTVQQLKQAGFEFVCDPVDQPYLWREATLLDPDSHRIFIFHAGENRIDPPWRLQQLTVGCATHLRISRRAGVSNVVGFQWQRSATVGGDARAGRVAATRYWFLLIVRRASAWRRPALSS